MVPTASASVSSAYQLDAIIGCGSYAAIYRARDLVHQKPVAVKFLLPKFFGNEAEERRFFAESDVLSKLHHRGIVKLCERNTGQFGTPAFVIELVEGKSLADVFKLAHGVGFPLRYIDAILSSLASSLDYIHKNGVVHQDIKASNVMLVSSPDGVRTVLLDFGIAVGPHLTGKASLNLGYGTPGIAAPEQAQGIATPAVDIYALGILTYQLLTGRSPFVGTTAECLLAQRSQPPPPLHEARPDLSEDACRAVHLALALDPLIRPASATAFLHQFRGTQPSPTPAQTTTTNAAVSQSTSPAARHGFWRQLRDAFIS